MEPIETRFWRYVKKTDGCWLWTGCIRGYGYGYLSHWPTRGAKVNCHRLSWMLHFGKIPKGLYVCHHCDVPACVRPDHLFIGTARDNKLDAVSKSRHARGIKINTAKLNERKVRAIRSAYPGKTQQMIADKYGVSQRLVSLIVRKESWSWLI